MALSNVPTAIGSSRIASISCPGMVAQPKLASAMMTQPMWALPGQELSPQGMTKGDNSQRESATLLAGGSDAGNQVGDCHTPASPGPDRPHRGTQPAGEDRLVSLFCCFYCTRNTESTSSGHHQATDTVLTCPHFAPSSSATSATTFK